MPDTEVKEKVRVIQFQMATDAVTGGSFQITSDIPRNANSIDLAAELSILREAGMTEMAASNRRRLEHARIVKKTLEDKVKARREAGEHLANKDIDEARMHSNIEIAKLESVCVADDAVLLQYAPQLDSAGH